MVDVQSIAEQVLRQAGIPFRKLSAIVLNRGAGEQNWVILLVFLDGASEPSYIAKIASDAEGGGRLKSEHDNLVYLHTQGSAVLRDSVPAAVLLTEIDGRHVFVETAFNGTRMKNFDPDRYFASRQFPKHLQQIASWLVDFHSIPDGATPMPRAEEDAPEVAIDRYRSDFEVSPALDTLLSDAQSALEGADVPLGPWHEDFCTANILVNDDAIQVIDWEHALRRSWPLADLLHCLMSVWCVEVSKGQDAKVRNYRRLLFESHALEEPLKVALRTYVDALALPRELLMPLSVISWVAHANRKHVRLQSAGLDHTHGDWPLVMFEDRRCLNLELLAELAPNYLLSRL